MKKMNWLICVIAVVSALSIACGDTGSGSPTGADSGKEASSREEEKEEGKEEKEDKEEEKARDDSNQADEEKEFKQQCQNVDYREYFRNDRKYIGEKIKVEILVDQVIEGDCRGYDVLGDEYYISDLRTGEDKFRIMEGDWITVYGEFAGVQQITRALGEYESDIFCIDGRYIDLYEEENPSSFESRDYEAPQTAAVAKEKGEYIFPDSDTRRLTEEEVSALSPELLRIAKNELYARRGRIFTSEDLQQYFESKSWYSGTIPGDQFNEGLFNQIEKDNIALLQQYIDGSGQGGDTGYAERGLAINYEDAVPQLPGTYCYYADPADRNGLRMELTIEEDGYTYVGFYEGEYQAQRSIILTNLMNDMMYMDEDGMVSFSCSDYGKVAYYEDLGGDYSGTYVFLP